MEFNVICAIVLSAFAAYLLGSVNTSIIISKLMGATDIRKHGSGNAGATNTLRVLGKKAAVFVVLGDAAKGVAAVLLAMLFERLFSADSLCRYIASVAVVLGHIFPVFFGFRGGKGIMTAIAVVFTLNPAIGGLLVVVFAVVIICSGYVSLSSCIAAACFPLFVYWLENGNTSFLICASAISLVAIIKHRTNIVRLIKGTESRIFGKKQ